MGFLDKVKAQAEQAVKQGQEKLEDVQAKKKADGLLRDLGAWYYARETDRDEGQAPDQIARLIGELQAHEAEHGPLGSEREEPPAPPPPGGGTPPPPPGGVAPAAPPPPVSPPVASSPPPVSSPPPPTGDGPTGAPPPGPSGAPPSAPGAF